MGKNFEKFSGISIEVPTPKNFQTVIANHLRKVIRVKLFQKVFRSIFEGIVE